MMVDFDVIVVGAGTAGIPCAIEAARTRRVLVVEADEQIGGTLWVSAGHMSAAGARRQRDAGIDDDPELHFADIMAIGGGGGDPEIIRAAVEEAPRTIDWLDDLGFDFDPATPAIYRGHTPYSRPRTFWGQRKGLSILETMRPLWDEAVAAGRIELRTQTRVTGLHQTNGVVDGVHLSHGEQDQVVTADAVVLASGGYGSNEELFLRLTPTASRLVTNAMPLAQGDALLLAEQLGSELRFGDLHTPRLGIIENPPGSGRVDFWTAMLQLTAAERPPREIWVNRSGRRFVAEDRGDVTVQEHAVLDQPESTMWVVLDRAGLDAPGEALVRQWTADELDREADRGELVYRADTLAELAKRAGLNPDGLAAEVAAFNEAVGRGSDPFGRKVLLGSIDESPFYAIRVPAAVLCTFGGVKVDPQMRVLRDDGSVIDGLYTVGEAIGMGTTSGRAFCGGMAVTPALGFGRRVGRLLAD